MLSTTNYTYRNALLFATLAGCCLVSSIPLLDTGYPQALDIDILSRINLHRIRELDGFFRLVTDSACFVSILVPVTLLLIGGIRKLAGVWQKGIYSLSAYLTAVTLSTLLKYLINKPRPFIIYPFIEKVTSGGSPSFPSGHTTDAFLTAAVLSIVCQKRFVTAIIYLWASLVAYSRMSLGVHYPSDVLAGIAVGTIAALVCYEIVNRLSVRRQVAA